MWWMKQWIICIWNHSQSIIVSTIWNNQKPITNNQAWISKKNNLKLKLAFSFIWAFKISDLSPSFDLSLFLRNPGLNRYVCENMNVPKHGQFLQWQGWQDPTKCELLTFHLTRYEVNIIALHCVKLGSLEYPRFHYVKIGNLSLPIFYSIHIYLW